MGQQEALQSQTVVTLSGKWPPDSNGTEGGTGDAEVWGGDTLTGTHLYMKACVAVLMGEFGPSAESVSPAIRRPGFPSRDCRSLLPDNLGRGNRGSEPLHPCLRNGAKIALTSQGRGEG